MVKIISRHADTQRNVLRRFRRCRGAKTIAQRPRVPSVQGHGDGDGNDNDIAGVMVILVVIMMVIMIRIGMVRMLTPDFPR